VTQHLTAKEHEYAQDKLVDWLKSEQHRLKTVPKTLHGVAYLMFIKGEWQYRIEYLHAEDTARARVAWAAGVPKGFKLGINAQLIGIAPVVGVFVEDEKKEIYSV
jgi:hypothetical protein